MSCDRRDGDYPCEACGEVGDLSCCCQCGILICWCCEVVYSEGFSVCPSCAKKPPRELTVSFNEREFRVIAELLRIHAKGDGEDVIGSIMLAGGFRLISDHEIVHISQLVNSVRPIPRGEQVCCRLKNKEKHVQRGY